MNIRERLCLLNTQLIQENVPRTTARVLETSLELYAVGIIVAAIQVAASH